LFWDYPSYGPHSHTEVWRHDSNSIGDAQLIGVSSGISFVDPVGEDASYYYWARHVSLYDVYGPFNSPDGTLAETALNVEELLDVLTGAITESQLYQTLGDRINLIDGGANLVNSVSYRIAQEASARAAAIAQEASNRTAAIAVETANRITAVNNEASARSTAISNEAAARAAAISSAVTTLQSQIDELNAIDAWSSAVSYVIDDLVQHNSKLWQAVAANSNSEPTTSNANWALIGDYTSLGDAVGANSASIQQINYVNSNSTSAAAQAIAALEATVEDPVTGVTATATGLSSLTAAVNNGTTGLSATVTRVGALESTVNNPLTGVNATSSALDLVEATVNNGTTGVVATANRVSTLESSVNNPTTGLSATRATLLNDYYTKATVDSAISTSSSQLSAAINLKNRTYRQDSAPSTNLVTGDVWFDSDDGNKSYRWDGMAWVASDDTRIAGTIANLTNNYYTAAQTNSAIAGSALTLQTQIDSKNKTFRQDSAPGSSGLIAGDLWFDSDDNNKSYRWSGSAWVATDDARIASTAANLTNNYYTKSATDSAIAAATLNLVTQSGLTTALGSYATTATLTNNYYTASQTDSAISAATSTLVSNTALTNALSSYATNATLTTNYYTKTETNSAISTATSSLVSTTALNNALTSYVTNSTLTTNYYTATQTNTAISNATLNLVSNTNLTNTLNSYVTNSTLSNNYYTKTDVDTALSGQSTTLSSQINVKNRTYRQTSAPSTDLVIGDVWFDSDDSNKAYRWNGSSWIATDDTRIAGTISNLELNYYTKTSVDSAIATSALTLNSAINAKNRSYYQTSAPGASGLVQGDLWFDSDDNNKAYRWGGSSWVAIDDARISSTAASLTNNYYTKTSVDSAISAATQNLVSTTTFNNTLGSYVTNATLTSNYYTKTATDSAISSASNTLTANFNNTLTGYATTAAVQQNYFAKADGQALQGQYTVKIDLNGHVSGFGLASTVVNGTPSSAFIIRADKFAIVNPSSTANNLTNTPSADTIPFTVVTTTQTVNGVSVPPGVYVKDAYIQNGTITNAKIGNGQIDDAKIGSLNADKITAGTIDTARLAIDNVTLDSYYDSSIGRNRLRIRDLGVDTAQIKDAAIISAKVQSLNVGKLTGDVTKFLTGYSAPSGAIPATFTSYINITLPKSEHPQGHKPYIQVSVRDAAPYQVGGYLEIYAAQVGDGTTVPALGPIYPTSQQYWYDYDPELGYPELMGWTLFFNGQLDIQAGDTITNNNSEVGTVSYVLFNGSQTIVSVETYGSLGSYYTRTRAVLGNGVVGPYTLILDTYWDAYDMTSLSVFGGLTQTTRAIVFDVRVRAQWANALYIKAIDAVVMGIR